MRKVIISLVISLVIIICLLFIYKGDALACWAYLTISELEEQADHIFIGHFNGEMSEDGIVRHGVRYWVVEIEHTLKGSDQEVIDIVTPGSSLSVISVSTDYKLTDVADGHMLLYLNKTNDGKYSPITPQGIINLEATEGGRILNAYNVVGRDDYEILEIVKSINRMVTKDNNYILKVEIFVCILVVLGLLLTVILNWTEAKRLLNRFFKTAFSDDSDRSNQIAILLLLAASLLIAAAALLYLSN